MNGMRQARGACDTHGMTDAPLRLLGSGRLVVIVGAYSTPWLCFNSSTEQVDVYSRFSVMIGPALHLTPSGGVVDGVAGIRNENSFWIRPVGLYFYTHGGKTGRAMIKYPG